MSGVISKEPPAITPAHSDAGAARQQRRKRNGRRRVGASPGAARHVPRLERAELRVLQRSDLRIHRWVRAVCRDEGRTRRGRRSSTLARRALRQPGRLSLRGSPRCRRSGSVEIPVARRRRSHDCRRDGCHVLPASAESTDEVRVKSPVDEAGDRERLKVWNVERRLHADVARCRARSSFCLFLILFRHHVGPGCAHAGADRRGACRRIRQGGWRFCRRGHPQCRAGRQPVHVRGAVFRRDERRRIVRAGDSRACPSRRNRSRESRRRYCGGRVHLRISTAPARAHS